jgi:DNA-binding IclR family transcriptional regulator
MLEDVARQGGQATHTRKQIEALLVETREHGLSRSLGQPIPGIDAFCAPVFDSAGNLVLAITAMGPSATFDSAWDGAVAAPLKRCADEVSARLGTLASLDVARHG